MPPADPESEARWRAARNAAQRAAVTLARNNGAQIVSRPPFHGAHTTVSDVEPLAGLRAAREIELGARHTARNYLRDAREAGHSWLQIGSALGLTPGGDADQAGETVAEAAYTYAAGQPDPDAPWRHRSFVWRCGSCQGVISDQGLCNGPADDERGHADNCARLARTIAAWDAEWEADI